MAPEVTSSVPSVATTLNRLFLPEDPIARLFTTVRLPVNFTVLVPEDGGGLVAGSDVQVIDRGGFKFVCCAAMRETSVRMVRLVLSGLLPGSGGFSVENILRAIACLERGEQCYFNYPVMLTLKEATGRVFYTEHVIYTYQENGASGAT